VPVVTIWLYTCAGGFVIGAYLFSVSANLASTAIMSAVGS